MYHLFIKPNNTGYVRSAMLLYTSTIITVTSVPEKKVVT
jgi:hypothetical protein